MTYERRAGKNGINAMTKARIVKRPDVKVTLRARLHVVAIETL
jgi:hypothetical protein